MRTSYKDSLSSQTDYFCLSVISRQPATIKPLSYDNKYLFCFSPAGEFLYTHSSNNKTINKNSNNFQENYINPMIRYLRNCLIGKRKSGNREITLP